MPPFKGSESLQIRPPRPRAGQGEREHLLSHCQDEQALIPRRPAPKGKGQFNCALPAGLQDRRQGLAFILGSSNSRNALREVLALSLPQFPGSPVHCGARSLNFAVGQALVLVQVQLLMALVRLSSHLSSKNQG